MNTPSPIIIAIAGGSGCGKTTLARIITEELFPQSSLLSLDQYYSDLSHLSVEERKEVNFDHPDILQFSEAAEHIDSLLAGSRTSTPDYDFSVHNRTEKDIWIEPQPVIVFEGMHTLYHKPLLDKYAMHIFLNVPEETRWERKLERDMRERGRSYEDVEHMWNRFTKPMHNEFVQPMKERAEFVFEESYTPEILYTIQEEIQKRLP